MYVQSADAEHLESSWNFKKSYFLNGLNIRRGRVAFLFHVTLIRALHASQKDLQVHQNLSSKCREWKVAMIWLAGASCIGVSCNIIKVNSTRIILPELFSLCQQSSQSEARVFCFRHFHSMSSLQIRTWLLWLMFEAAGVIFYSPNFTCWIIQVLPCWIQATWLLFGTFLAGWLGLHWAGYNWGQSSK